MMPAARPRAFARPFRFDHATQCSGRRRQLDGFARLVRRPIGLVASRSCSPATVRKIELTLNRARRARASENLLGVPDRRRRDFFEAHRAPSLEHRQRGVERAGHDGRIESLALEILLRDRYQSTSTACGAQPCPTTEVTLPSFFG